MDGKYFYTLAEYENMMCKITDFFPGEKVAFLITSNENISTSYFSSLNCFVIPNSFSIKDLHGLSQTDYIIGPPSTFSAWASLYGDIPLYFIENSKNNFTRDSFKKIQDVWF